MAGMGGFTRPLVSSLTNCWTTRAAMGTALTPAAPMQGLIFRPSWRKTFTILAKMIPPAVLKAKATAPADVPPR
jgi:hypothetical protein